MKTSRWASVLLSLLLAGCANFQAVSDFATETQQLTGTVHAEFAQLESLCLEQARLSIAILDIDENAPDSPLKGCAAYRAAQGRLADVTVETLQAYGKTLAALAENRSFDLGPEIKGTSAKLAALKTQDGSALVDAAQLGALTKVLALLADVATQSRREESIRRLVAEKPSLVANARLLRSFFASPAGVTAVQPPYENLLALSSNAMRSYETLLRSEAIRRAEPIRARELLLALNQTREWLKARQGPGTDHIGRKIVAAIDAWILAADSFERDALRPDAQQLHDRLKDLRAKVVDARAAVRAL